MLPGIRGAMVVEILLADAPDLFQPRHVRAAVPRLAGGIELLEVAAGTEAVWTPLGVNGKG